MDIGQSLSDPKFESHKDWHRERTYCKYQQKTLKIVFFPMSVCQLIDGIMCVVKEGNG